MTLGLRNIWKQGRGFGKLIYPFRIFSHVSGIVLIWAHHYENQLAYSYVDYAVLGLLVLTPHVFYIRYVKSGNQMSTALEQMTLEFLFLGLGLGALNLSILPTFIFTLAITLNYISVTGYKKLYVMILVPIGFFIVSALDGFYINFGYGNLVMVLSLSYGTVHFLILAFVSFNYANKYNKGQKVLRQQNIEIEEQKQEILLQAQKLEALNKSLKVFNEKLEVKVGQRTLELHDKNKKLTQYAFINAHKLRAPVATIMGLVQFFDYEEHSRDQEKQIKQKLKVTVQELERTIVEIRKKLEEEGLAVPQIENTNVIQLDSAVGSN